MSDASDIEELLGKHHQTVFMRRLWAGCKLLLVMASAFGGAVWTARGYLEQLATKDQVAALLKGQDEKFDRIDARLTALGERQAKTESRVDDIRGTITVRPR
jgi:hypothetical protein